MILQDQTGAAAEAAGLKMLAPTNADGDSGKQITDVRSLIGAGAKGLIVVANDSKAIIPALDFAAVAERAGRLDRHRAGRRKPLCDRARRQSSAWAGSPARRMAKAIGDSGKVLSLQGAQTSINGRERSEGLPRLHHARSIRTSS